MLFSILRYFGDEMEEEYEDSQEEERQEDDEYEHEKASCRTQTKIKHAHDSESEEEIKATGQQRIDGENKKRNKCALASKNINLIEIEYISQERYYTPAIEERSTGLYENANPWFESDNEHIQGQSFELYFVNRANEAYQIAHELITQIIYNHGSFVHIGQMNGTGKTTMVRNFKKIMDHYNYWDILNEKYSAKLYKVERERIKHLRNCQLIILNMAAMTLEDTSKSISKIKINNTYRME